MSLEGKWVVESLAIGGELQPPLPTTRPTLEFEGDRVGGNATINRFMGSIRGEEKLFGPLATTMMAGPEDHMVQEQIYLTLLAKVDSHEVEPSEIRLVSEGLILVILTPEGTNDAGETSNP